MWRGVSKSGSPISRWITSRPWRSSSFARASTLNAVSVPSRARLSASRVARSTAIAFLLRRRGRALERLRQQGGDVRHPQRRPRLTHAVVEHDGAERARDRERVGAGGGRLARALLVDPPAALLHPHVRAARPAAERLLAAARHLE